MTRLHLIARALVAGTILGLVILGVGGRLAMRAIQVARGNAPGFSVGGSMTVVVLGAVSGLVGAAIALLSQFVAQRYLPNPRLQYILFGAALALVTMRGLSGTPRHEWWYFYLLVVLYGLAQGYFMARQSSPGRQSHRPIPRDSE